MTIMELRSEKSAPGNRGFFQLTALLGTGGLGKFAPGQVLGALSPFAATATMARNKKWEWTEGDAGCLK